VQKDELFYRFFILTITWAIFNTTQQGRNEVRKRPG